MSLRRTMRRKPCKVGHAAWLLHGARLRGQHTGELGLVVVDVTLFGPGQCGKPLQTLFHVALNCAACTLDSPSGSSIAWIEAIASGTC